MQQEPEGTNKLESLLESIREDVEAERAGSHGAHKRLLEKSAQFQLALETPADTTMRMRFAAGLRYSPPTANFQKYLLRSLYNSSCNNSRFVSVSKMSFLLRYVQKGFLRLPLRGCRRTRA